MDFKEIKELIKIFDASGLDRLSITQEQTTIKLQKNNQNSLQAPSIKTIPITQDSPLQAPTQAQSAEGEIIHSPMVGTFYRCPSPNSPAYVNINDKVKKGQTLAIIEAMKIMNEIEAEFDCIIKDIIPADAQPVEYDSPLFVVERI